MSGELLTLRGEDAADAYGRALLALIDRSAFIAVEEQN
jgi:hypothetical protein